MTSIFILLSISLDRFFAIVYPLKAHRSRLRCVVAVSSVWLVSVVIAAPNLVYHQLYEVEYLNWVERWCAESWPKVCTGKLSAGICGFQF